MSVLGMVQWLRFSIVALLLPALHVNFEAEAKRFHSIAGPFDILVRRIDHCPDEIESKGKVNFYVHEIIRRHKNGRVGPILRGNATFHVSLNDNLDASVHIASWSNVAGWRENAHIINSKNVCRSMTMWFPNIWREARIGTLGEDVNCPFYPGFVRFDNITFAWKDLPIKSFFYGRWRADLNLQNRNEEILGCLRIYGDTIPKI